MSNIFDNIQAGLQSRGFSPDQALGITSGIYAEGGVNANGTFNRNPTSGAFGIGQWLGARKTGLFKASGTTAPTFDQQLDYLASELRGGDPGGKAVLKAGSADNTLTAYITKFMRPAAGKETTGDLARGATFLTSNASANKTIGDSLAAFGLGGVSNTIGEALSAPGNAVDAGVQKLVGGLDPSQWFQRIALAILAILLIGIALSMLAGKPALSMVSKFTPVPA